ncbi:hypothetical protein PR202_ga24683 [Eleusine coracana subsp. coracana]|uniref:Uncharacterized protein n=1 Tax=Eleusine coracana subsp. coracana TaxID=191504 RepID=A0AAV5D8D1_ELECO|nr:hypothetical protein PR202_ga24683 [Eleusine coracana subsp. coracana]
MVFAKQRVREAAGTTDVLTVAGSPWFLVYGLDFGFRAPGQGGRRVHREDQRCRGGQETGWGRRDRDGVCLPPDDMDAFRKCFDDAVTELDADGELTGTTPAPGYRQRKKRGSRWTVSQVPSGL